MTTHFFLPRACFVLGTLASLLVLTACGADVVGAAATTAATQAKQAQQAQQQVQQVQQQLDAAAQQAQTQRQAAEDAAK